MSTFERRVLPLLPVLGAVALAGVSALAAQPPAEVPDSAPSVPTKIFFARHAEKVDTSPDSALSDAGSRRARTLARVLADAGVTHLYASEFRRAQDTLRPLASESGREVTVISARDPDLQLRTLRELPGGSVAVVAGHSNTVPGMVCALAGEVKGLDCTAPTPVLDESEHDRLFLVILQPRRTDGRTPAWALGLRYGE